MEDHLRADPAGANQTEGGAQNGSQQRTASRTRTRPRLALPTDRLKFGAQKAALKAIVVASNSGEQGVSADDMAPRMGVVPATAGLNNAFFVEAGFIIRERKGYYKPTPTTVEYARKATFNETQAAALLGEPMRKSWYFREVEKQAAMGPTPHKQMIDVLAHAAGASADYTVQLGSVLTWLEYVGLIVITNGFVQLGQRDLQELHRPPSREELRDESDRTPAGDEGKGTTENQEKPPPERGATILSLNFDLALTADDLHKLTGEQITALFEAVGKVAAIKATMK